MTSRHLTLRQPECNSTGNDVTSPLETDSQHQPYCQNGCHLAKYIVSNILMKAHGRKFDRVTKIHRLYSLLFPLELLLDNIHVIFTPDGNRFSCSAEETKRTRVGPMVLLTLT